MGRQNQQNPANGSGSEIHGRPAGGKHPVDPIGLLKSMVLTIDWEINDEVMSRFIQQVNRLKTVYRKDKSAQLLLGILDSVGKYIRSRKEKASPDAVTLLKSAYVCLERVVKRRHLSPSDKSRMLSRQIDQFNALKRQVTGGSGPEEKRVGRTEKATARHPEEADLPADQQMIQELILSAMEEIKTVIRDEVRALKEELRGIRIPQESSDVQS